MNQRLVFWKVGKEILLSNPFLVMALVALKKNTKNIILTTKQS